MTRPCLLLFSLFLTFVLTMPPPDYDLHRLAKRAGKCGAAERKGAAGIGKNINIQKQEIKDTKHVAKVDPGLHGGKGRNHRRDIMGAQDLPSQPQDNIVAVLPISPGDTPLIEARGSSSSRGGGGHGSGSGGGGNNNKNKPSTTNFKASKAKLEGTIQKGVDQRKYNQKTLPKDNKAQAGLAKASSDPHQ
jgi:hypothetical protein